MIQVKNRNWIKINDAIIRIEDIRLFHLTLDGIYIMFTDGIEYNVEYEIYDKAEDDFNALLLQLMGAENKWTA